MKKADEQIAMRVSIHTIVGNAVLSAFKLYAGIIGHSAAMVSDSMHSLSDVLSTVVVIVGVRLSGREPDKEHPYGHERFECVAAVVLAGMLAATGAGIGWLGLQTILSGDFEAITLPGLLPLIAAIVSVVSKEGMYWYTRVAAKRIESSALMADAWHHRSDALSSVGSFAGILCARLGHPIMDPMVSILISLLIIKVAVDVFRDATGKMTDKAADEKTEGKIRAVILSQEAVLGIDLLRTRLFGNRIYVDVDIRVDGAKSLHEAHGIAQLVHDMIESEVQMVKHCTVHVNPSGA